jgi:hypothetical protein
MDGFFVLRTLGSDVAWAFGPGSVSAGIGRQPRDPFPVLVHRNPAHTKVGCSRDRPCGRRPAQISTGGEVSGRKPLRIPAERSSHPEIRGKNARNPDRQARTAQRSSCVPPSPKPLLFLGQTLEVFRNPAERRTRDESVPSQTLATLRNPTQIRAGKAADETG